MKLITFEKLAELAVKREIESNWHIIGSFNVKMNIFKTEVSEKGLGKTITIWFETECCNPRFWDMMPVTVVYKGNNLSLGDISHRASKFFQMSVNRLHKKVISEYLEAPDDL